MSGLVVLASGNGSNLQALLDAGLPVSAVIACNPNARALERAGAARVPAVICPRHQDRRECDRLLAQSVAAFQPDLVVLAGWRHILTSDFLDHFRVINLHPALPGAFPGLHAIERAWKAWTQGELTETGVMVHLVPDEGVDCGPALASEVVPIEPEDTLESLTERIHSVEHRLLVDTVREELARASSTAVGLG